jgi:hypothetical protein
LKKEVSVKIPPARRYETIQKALNKILWENEGLRAEIVKDPKRVIEREFGIKFPEGLKVEAIDMTDPSTIYFILPVSPHEAFGFDLTEEQLEQVFGGVAEPTLVKNLISFSFEKMKRSI